MINTTSSHRAALSVLRELSYASIGVAYTQVGIAFLLPLKIVSFSNLTDADLFISTDGTYNYEVIAARSYKILDFTANTGTTDDVEMPVGTKFYVKSVSALPTSGSFYVTAMHTARN